MAASKDDKVFDVAKPGKAAANASSRPLIVGHKPILKDPMVKEKAIDELEENKTAKIDHDFEDDIPSGSPPLPTQKDSSSSSKKASAPSESKLNLNPLSSNKDKKSESKAKPSDSTVIPVKTTAVSSQAIAPTGPPKVDKAEAEKSISEFKKSESENHTSIEATTAAVAKKAEDQAPAVDEKSIEAEKLIESKKYHVPIGGKAQKKRSMRRIILGALLILLLGFALIYLMIDVGLIKTNIKLPFEFFKDNNVATPSVPVPQNTSSKPSTNSSSQPVPYKITTTVPSTWKKYNDPKTKLTFYYPDDWNEAKSFVVLKKDGSQNVFSDNASKNIVYTVSTKEASQMAAIQIDVFDQPMSQSVTQLKKYIQGPGNSKPGTSINITTTDILFSGKKAVEVKYTQNGATIKQIFVEANGYTYALPEISTDETIYKQNGTSANEVLTIHDSIKIE